MSNSARVDRDAGRSMFDEAARVSIAQLNPNTANAEDHHIQATVALIWPYSNSTGRLSLLLAERDIRLRKSKGQVKVTFHGGCAREVAQTQVGIGDYVRLGLRDVAWTRTGEEVSTPGKKVDWDIDISKRVKLECKRRDRAAITVNYTAKSPPPDKTNAAAAPIGGPVVNGSIKIQTTHALGPYFSPARQHSRRSTSSSFVDASLDPFADDDGYIVGKGRKKTKFTRHSGSWHLVDDGDRILAVNGQGSLPPSSPPQTPSRVQLEDRKQDVSNTQGREVQGVAIGASGATDDAGESSSIPSTGENVSIVHRDENVEHFHVQPDTVLELATEPESTQRLPMPMGPPRTPSPVLRRNFPQMRMPGGAVPNITPTPILRPLPSPGLALVSPLVERPGPSTGYFPIVANTESELDATGAYHGNLVPSIPTFNSAEYAMPDAHKHESSGGGAANISAIDNPNLGATVNDAGRLLAVTDNDDTEHQIPPLDSVFPDHQLTSVPEDVIITPTISEFVDLDALQQHIEDSAQESQNVVPEVQPEDEDMYGPPVDHKLDGVFSTDSPQNEPTLNTDEQPTPMNSALPSPTHFAHGSDVGNSIPEDMLGAVEQVTHQLPSILEGSAVLEQSGPAMVSYVTDEASEQRPQMHISPDANLVSHAAVQPSFGQLHAVPLDDKAPTWSDGTAEHVEDEATRARQRSVQKGPPTPCPEVVDLLSSSSESASPTSQVSDESFEESEPVQGYLDPMEHSAQDTVSFDVDESEKKSKDGGTDDDDLDTNNVVHIQADVGYLQNVITPDATQTDIPQADSKTPPRTDAMVILPPTPMLTQDKTNPILPSSPSAPQAEAGSHETSETPAPTSPVEETKSIRRATQRLTRKVLPSQIVTNEYFTPRRSARISQPSPSPTIATSPVMQQPISPTRSRTRSRRSLSISVQEQDGASLEKERVQPPTPARGISTRLSYFPRLSSLSEYFNAEVDVIAVCLADYSQPQRAKSGPKDFHTTLLLIDDSLDKDRATVHVQIFRPRKNALPAARRGDAVLLRNMKVQTLNHSIVLLSTETSAWAVFKRNSDGDLDVVVEGPPVEYEQAEKDAAARLISWWNSQGEKLYSEPLERNENLEVQEVASASQRMTRSQRRKANATDYSDGIDGPHNQESQTSPIQSTEHFDIPPLTTASPTQRSTERMSPTTPVKRSNHRRGNSRRSESVVHELRDGTRYVTEEDGRSGSVLHELRDGTSYIDE